MKTKDLWLFAAGFAVLGIAGCGETAKKGVAAIASPFKALAKPVKSVGKAVSTPFKDEGKGEHRNASSRSFEARISTDDYEADTTDGWDASQTAEVQEDWESGSRHPTRRRDKEQAKSLEALLNPGKHEFDDAFTKELKQLQEMEALTSKRASQYEAEARERRALAEQYRRKYLEAQERKERLRKIMEAYRRNPDAFASKEYNGKVFHQVPPSVAGRESGGHLEAGDISSCSAPKVWNGDKDSGAENEYVPPIDNPADLASGGTGGLAADPLSAQDANGGDPTRGTGATTSPVPPPPGKPAKLTAMILATDGTGPDAVAIIGAGRRKGVKKGMLFKLVDEKGRKIVLVVKDVYLTYARCYPHPAYAQGTIRVAARATLISGLGE